MLIILTAASLLLFSKTFDIICGTSTGGILAMLFAAEKQSIEAASELYDSLIVRIFRKDILGNAKLVLIQVRWLHGSPERALLTFGCTLKKGD